MAMGSNKSGKVMKRRDFLRATLVTAGAVMAPAACTDTSDLGGQCPLEDGSAYFPQSVASGDPRPDSVILWTRVDDPEASGDLTIELQVALDEGFTQIVPLSYESDRRSSVDEGAGATLVSVLAQEKYHHCVKVKVAGLQPATTYYYRFFYKGSGDSCYTSRVGRTKTAPADDADVPVRFAYISCQDFIGRYYNLHLLLAQEELDFVIVLGDYIYETTGDPGFQTSTEDRKVHFSDIQGAIALGEGDAIFYAARSLNNYRELYRTYRGDPALQAVHERFPVIATWDDHEYSNDCWGANSTYYDGERDELDVERRRNANQAWFEFMPVDYTAGDDFEYLPEDPAAQREYPQDITIYRDFRFGAHLHLVLTDLRTYRVDHLIPEDAYPGEVVVTQEAALAELGQIPAAATPYVDIDDPAYSAYRDLLVAAAPSPEYAAAKIGGNTSVLWINEIVAAAGAGAPPPIDLQSLGLKLGLSWYDAGKPGYYNQLGVRYFVAKDAYLDIARVLWNTSQGERQVIMGAEQEEWFLGTMEASDRTWKVWANEFCMVQMAIDLTDPALSTIVPPAFQKRFFMNVEAWDGFPDRREALLQRLGAVNNVVAVTGDIHAFYAGTPASSADPTKKIVEVVGSSMTSKTFKDELISQASADPALSALALLAESIDGFLTSGVTRPNPTLGYAKSVNNGFCVAEVSPGELLVTMHQLPSAEVLNNYYLLPDTGLFDLVDDVREKILKVQFKAVAGEKELYKYNEMSSAWQRWDPTTHAWV